MEYVFIALVVVAICAVAYYISTYNSFIKLQNGIEEAFSTMDVFLVKRAELIPNLVATVKGYSKHEAETLEKVIAARNSAHSPADKIAAENEMSSALKNIFALAESYPELKANTNFLNLQNQLTSLENDVASSRRYYNGVVKQYNTKLQTFPSSIIANMKNFQREPLFEVSSDSQRENVKVEF